MREVMENAYKLSPLKVDVSRAKLVTWIRFSTPEPSEIPISAKATQGLSDRETHMLIDTLQEPSQAIAAAQRRRSARA